MQNGGFLENRSTKPIGLGVVILAHVAVLTAVAVSHPEVVPGITYIPTTIFNVPDDAPPPAPPPPMPRQKMPEPEPTYVRPLVDSAATTQTQIDPPTTPAIPDIRPMQIDPPKAVPVFMPAAIDPRAQGAFQPDYPVALVRAGVEGSATVRVLIGADGRVKAVEMVNATDPAFFDATKKHALRYWRFKPATADGVATESWRTMTVRFKIQN